MSIIYQSGMGPRTDNTTDSYGPMSLRIGQVSAPYSPLLDPDNFDAYVDRCLKSWTVDVVLDKGEYYAGCMILVPQGNTREGLRRMFKFPHGKYTEPHWVGDTVIVGFLQGSSLQPVVLGALHANLLNIDSTKSLSDWETSGFAVATTRDEWIDRHDVVDYKTIPDNPLASSTERRDTGVDVTESHSVITGATSNPADNVQSLLLRKSIGGNLISEEHVVERGDAANRRQNSMYREDDSANNLTSSHQTVTDDGLASSVTMKDLAAQMVQLQHMVEVQAGIINTLLLQSDNAGVLTISHDTEKHRAAIISDGTNKNTSISSFDKDTSSNASLSFAENSLVVLRRANSGAPDSWVMLEEGGEVSVRSSFGATVRLSNGGVSVKSGSASIVVDDSSGVRIATKDGGFFTLTGGKAIVSSTAVAVTAATVSINTGAMRVGPNGSTNSVPSAEKLYSKLATLENRVMSLEKWGAVHAHTGNGRPPIVPPSQGGASNFISSEVGGDSLSSLKGD